MALLDALLLAGITGLVSASGTVMAMRTDIRWIIKSITELKERVTKLEEQKT